MVTLYRCKLVYSYLIKLECKLSTERKLTGIRIFT